MTFQVNTRSGGTDGGWGRDADKKRVGTHTKADHF